MAINTFDGELMPNNLQNASLIVIPTFLIASIASEAVLFIPLAIPRTISLPKFSDSFIPPSQLKNLEITDRIFSKLLSRSSKVGRTLVT